jgi:hypothetical protein
MMSASRIDAVRKGRGQLNTFRIRITNLFDSKRIVKDGVWMDGSLQRLSQGEVLRSAGND